MINLKHIKEGGIFEKENCAKTSYLVYASRNDW